MDERFEPDPERQREARAWEQETRDQGKPAIALDFATHWCPRHLRPYKAGWPSGAPAAMLMLFQAFAEDERAQAMAGGDSMKIAAVALECSPLCCFVGDEKLAAIYAGTNVEPPRAR
jgi:hypothetical protein